ncbi:MAG: hypothetical protein WA397_00970 [Roseiarcus sp.]
MANKRGAPGGIISLQGGGIIQESLGAIIPLQTGGFVGIGSRTLALVGAGKNAAMFADDLSLGGDNDALGIDSYADWTIGEGRRHAIAIAVQMD